MAGKGARRCGTGRPAPSLPPLPAADFALRLSDALKEAERESGCCCVLSDGEDAIPSVLKSVGAHQQAGRAVLLPVYSSQWEVRQGEHPTAACSQKGLSA